MRLQYNFGFNVQQTEQPLARVCATQPSASLYRGSGAALWWWNTHLMCLTKPLGQSMGLREIAPSGLCKVCKEIENEKQRQHIRIVRRE